jgi:hypothetical protein
MFAQLVSTYHLHPILDHFTIALLTFGIAAEILSAAAILLSRNRAGFLIRRSSPSESVRVAIRAPLALALMRMTNKEISR